MLSFRKFFIEYFKPRRRASTTVLHSTLQPTMSTIIMPLTPKMISTNNLQLTHIHTSLAANSISVKIEETKIDNTQALLTVISKAKSGATPNRTLMTIS